VTPSPWTPSESDLQLLANVIREVTRLRRLSPADAQDFAQSVQARCLERGYDVFRRFSGRSSLRTYLRVVVTRLLLDWQNSSYGKWRPSATASRLGEAALLLERLIERDGCTPAEAVNVVSTRHPGWHVDMLRQIADALPRRVRRRFVSDEVLEWECVAGFDDPVAAEEERHARKEIARILRKAFRQLPRADQQLVAMRCTHDVSVRTLAEHLRTDPRLLYRRFDRALRTLRRALKAAGVTQADALAAVAIRR
jgi:RNA polymerase sigma factor (sigma-70 family)